MAEHWIRTYRGRSVDLMRPTPDDIDPTELAILLGRLQRFGGHCRTLYTVAEHSARVALLCEPAIALCGLLHDAHEGYLGLDMIRPLKSLLDSQRLEECELAWDRAVAERFGFHPYLLRCDAVKHADAVMLATEKRDVLLDDTEWPGLPAPHTCVVTPHPEPAVLFAATLEGFIDESVNLAEIRRACGYTTETPRRHLAGAVL
jgi:hypothetical protein